MANAISSWNRWSRWTSLSSVRLATPAPTQMACYMKLVSEGGPTAAWSQARSLAWLSRHLKIILHVQHELVSPWCVPKTGHSAVSKTPAIAKITVHWETLLRSNNPYVSQIAAANLICAWGVVRFKHMQRSRWIKSRESGAVAFCSLGKSKRDGSRGGFWWTMPQAGLTGMDIAELVVSLYRQINVLPGTEDFIV